MAVDGAFEERYALLGPYRSAVETRVAKLQEDRILARIWAHDHTVWKPEPAEITNRLGWLHAPHAMAPAWPALETFRDEVRAEGFRGALLLGMGGSSLAPEVYRRIFGVREGFLDLSVLDSTDPGAILAAERNRPMAETLFIVSTKSGGTVETLSLFKYFFLRAQKELGPGRVGNHFVAVTDPGSGLEKSAKELGFRKIFLNDPNIGGRYSALTYFGLVPAALIGIDIEALLARAQNEAEISKMLDAPTERAPSGGWLGTVLATLAEAGRDKLTLVPSPALAPFGAWAEQLIAESTGKEGKGILPVDGEPLAEPDRYGQDRIFIELRYRGDRTHSTALQTLSDAGHPVVRLVLEDLQDLAAEFFRWEMATAVAGSLLKVNPFDQPNVESAKVSTREMVDTYQREGRIPAPDYTVEGDGISVIGGLIASSPGEVLDAFLSGPSASLPEQPPFPYVALQAFLQPTPETSNALASLRRAIQDRKRLTTVVGYGPRYLHSTGQLHKGDGGRGLFIQFTADTPEDVPIPEGPGEGSSSLSFGVLERAQALGDREALQAAGRSVLLFHLGGDVVGGLARLEAAVR
ncbi:MAG: glucose-6-phosphate isomerase [Planctomycetota bacterium]|jgi:glucose-6-phosphate isomerase